MIVKILFFVVLGVSVAGLIWFSSIDQSNPLEYSAPVFIEEWTVTGPGGDVYQAGSSFRNDGKRTGVFIIESKLPDRIVDDSYLCFIIGGDVAVYIDGELRKDFVASRDITIPGGCVKRFYMRVPVGEEDAGADVKIVRTSTSRSGFVYQNTFVSDSGVFFNFMMSRYGLSFLLAELLLIFALVIAIISVVMMLLYRRRIEMLYGALSILVIAGWLITNSYLYPFIYGHYHVDGVMNYMLCLMMPFNLVFYLDALQHGRYRHIMRGILIVAAANLIVWPILHFTGTFTFPNALLYIDAFLGLELLIVAGILVMDLIRGGLKEYKFTAIGISGFLVCGVGVIVVLNFVPVINSDILMLTGLAFLLTLTVVQQMIDLKHVREEGQRAVDLSEAKTRFLASMSHEIRTPINAVLGMNEMILRENRDPVIEEYASSVKSSGQMLLMLVNDVLDFSKIEAGKMETNHAPFRFSSVLRNTMPMLKERAGGKNLKLRVILMDEVPDGMISDEFRIRQILINLMNNAIKYTDAGSVSLMLDGEYTGGDGYLMKMRVKDTGRGISEEDQKHLFEAFSRADIKKNRSIEGTGLGLAIVKRIVDSMEGEISVMSKYGEGSEFIVSLPVRVTDRTPLTEDYEAQAEKAVTVSAKADYSAPDAAILAVDDNTSNLKIVSLFLKRVGIVPELCDSGTKAIELCKSKRYDLILLDHMMPDPDGIKTLSIIKLDEDSRNRETPVVVLTANAIAGSAKLYADAGFVDYLTKPLDSYLLEETIKKYLPKEKVLPPANPAAEDTVSPAGHPEPDRTQKPAAPAAPVTFEEKLKSIDGLDFEAAMSHAGYDAELLEEMVRIISSECDDRIARMQECVTAKDWKGYGLVAHTVKGLMASIGMTKVSERAKTHQFAAESGDETFIASDCEGFFADYRDICYRLQE